MPVAADYSKEHAALRVSLPVDSNATLSIIIDLFSHFTPIVLNKMSSKRTDSCGQDFLIMHRATKFSSSYFEVRVLLLFQAETNIATTEMASLPKDYPKAAFLASETRATLMTRSRFSREIVLRISKNFEWKPPVKLCDDPQTLVSAYTKHVIQDDDLFLNAASGCPVLLQCEISCAGGSYQTAVASPRHSKMSRNHGSVVHVPVSRDTKYWLVYLFLLF